MKKIRGIILVLLVFIVISTSEVFAAADFEPVDPICYMNDPVSFTEFFKLNNGCELVSMEGENYTTSLMGQGVNINNENQTVTFTATGTRMFKIYISYKKGNTGEIISFVLIAYAKVYPKASEDTQQVNLTAYAHVENIGDQTSTTSESVTIGTTGQSLQMEGFTLKTDNPNLIPVYEAHVEDYGWMPAVENGAFAGTRGEHKRIECFRISLKGSDADKYDICYRTHVQEYGWLDWARTGQTAGTTNHAFRCEAMDIRIIPKGSPLPDEETFHVAKTRIPAIEAFSREEGEMLYYVNMLRKAENGSPYLTGNAHLHEVAQIRANELPQLFEHTRPNGTSCETALDDYRNSHGLNPSDTPSFSGENICYGGNNVAEDYIIWFNSASHHQNMVTGWHRYLAYATNNTGTRYAVQYFGY